MYDNQKGNIEKIEVLKQNGSRLSATNNGTHVVFSNLEPGDAIHLTYTLEDYYDGKLANHFWGTHTFATFLPVVQTRYGLITPQGMTYDWQVTNGDLQPTERTLDNEVLRVWEANNVPAIKYEPYMSNLADIAPVLHFSSFPDWDYIVQWYAELAQAKSKTDFEVESIATSLFKDTPDLTDREKVEKIYQYIVNEIRYRSVSFLQSGLIPQRASTTLSARQGDCKDVSTLFVALCNTQQIPANLVLVNTLDNGRQEMALPSINFNHCIAKVALEAETFFVELTSENLPFASLWAPGVDAFTLEIPADPARTSVRPSLLNPTNRPPDYTRRTARVTFDGATMYVDKQNQKSGVAAASMRDTYKNLGTVQQFKEMQQAVNTDFPGIKVTKVTFGPDLAANQETLGYEYAYEVPDAFSEVAGMRIFRLPWADNFSATDVISTSEREHPLETWQFTWSSQQEETLNIEIPEGMTLLEVPADESYTLPELTYNLTFRQTGNTLVATRKYEMLARKVDAARYADMKAALEKIIKADQKQVAFRAK
jgi:hypothetical protein